MRQGSAAQGIREIRFQYRNSLRSLQGCWRINDRASEVLPEQSGVLHEHSGDDEGFQTSEYSFLIIGHSLRRRRSAASDRTDSPPARNIAIRQHKTDCRRHPARLLPRLRGPFRHRTTLFQPYRRTPIRPYRRTSSRRTQQSTAFRHPDSRRNT